MEKIIIEWNTVNGDGDYVAESDDYDKYNDVNELLGWWVKALLDTFIMPLPEVPGSIPSQGPRNTKDVIKMVPVVPLFSTQHWKVKYWLFLKN